jgi:hypothetical protein
VDRADAAVAIHLDLMYSVSSAASGEHLFGRISCQSKETAASTAGRRGFRVVS